MTAKVTRTDGQTPSAELVREAQAEVEVTDSTGRVIKLRKPGVLAQFKLVKAMGAESAENTTLMSMYLPLLYVSQIGEDAVFPPTSEREIEGTITRLDEAGLDAVMRGVQEHFTVQSPDEVKAAIKVATSPGLEESLWLVHNGVPFDLALSLDEVNRAAFAILFSQFNGRRFDWQSFTFEEDK